jgi:GNAT superfamily N-acetyltransferase
MASTDALQLSALGTQSLSGCMALSAEAGWNQTEDDWALFMRHGAVFGLPDDDGNPVATGAILPYPQNFAWISMVLVTAGRRRQRIGTRILESCCAEITRRGLVAVLDATPAGERVYRPLGFAPMFGLSRWQGHGDGRSVELPAEIRPMAESDLAVVSALDATAFGARRTFLLQNFYHRAPQFAFVTANVDGFVLARPGRIATQIGPLVAPDERTAAALLATAIGGVTGPVFLDLCDRWDKITRYLGRRGFSVQRPFLRMGLRCNGSFGDAERSFVVAGPEFG